MDRKAVQKEIFRLSFPTMGGFLCQSLYDIVDMVFIGMLDKAAIAASTIFITLFWVLEVLNEIVGASSVSMISQAYGSGDMEKTRQISQETIFFKVVLAIIGAAVMGLLLPWFYNLYSDDPAVVKYGMDYGIIRLAFLPVFFSSYTVNTIFRCTGDAKTPMRLLIIASVMNVVLDPICMFDTVPGTSIPGLGWGITGAAVATVVSISFSFIAGFALLLAGKAPIRIKFREIFHLHGSIDKKLILVGLPSGCNLLLRNLSTFVILKLVSSFGTEAIAILGVATRIYQFAIVPSNGISMGSGIIVGHCLGAEKEGDAKLSVHLTMLDCFLFSGVFALVIWFFPSSLLSLFLGGEAPGADGVFLMRVFVPCILCLSLMSGFSAAFNGSGYTKPFVYSAVISQWGASVPYALVVTLLLHKSLPWLWVAYIVGDAVDLLSRFLFYRKGSWLRKRV